MAIDLSPLSVAELEALAVQVQDEIKAKKVLAKKTLLADLERVARDAGVSLTDLFGDAAAKAGVGADGGARPGPGGVPPA